MGQNPKFGSGTLLLPLDQNLVQWVRLAAKWSLIMLQWRAFWAKNFLLHRTLISIHSFMFIYANISFSPLFPHLMTIHAIDCNDLSLVQMSYKWQWDSVRFNKLQFQQHLAQNSIHESIDPHNPTSWQTDTTWQREQWNRKKPNSTWSVAAKKARDLIDIHKNTHTCITTSRKRADYSGPRAIFMPLVTSPRGEQWTINSNHGHAIIHNR